MSKSCENNLHRNSSYTTKDNGHIRLVKHNYSLISIYIIITIKENSSHIFPNLFRKQIQNKGKEGVKWCNWIIILIIKEKVSVFGAEDMVELLRKAVSQSQGFIWVPVFHEKETWWLWDATWSIEERDSWGSHSILRKRSLPLRENKDSVTENEDHCSQVHLTRHLFQVTLHMITWKKNQMKDA